MHIQAIAGLPIELTEKSAILIYKTAGEKNSIGISIFKNHLPDELMHLIETADEDVQYSVPGFLHSKIYLYVIDKEKISVDYFRNHLNKFLSSYKKIGYKQLYILLPETKDIIDIFESQEYLVRSASEGILYASYKFDKYKSDAKEAKLPSVHFLSSDTVMYESALQFSRLLMNSVFFARDLANEPANYLTPEKFAKICKSKLTSKSVAVQVLKEKEIKAKKMGGVLAVSKGSKNPPRFIVMEYKCGKEKAPHVAVVGKGVCFDSGGISIKPADGMGKMKADMAGGAVTAALIMAARDLKLPYNITGIVPAVENMISGSAMRPGDIVTTSSGKTIEVDNTDAEGRMILADALHYASGLKADLIIDLATLTGASAVALAEFVTSMFSKNEVLAKYIYEAGLKTYERVWRLPLWDDYNKLIESDVADVKNTGGRWGGAITAAKFLEHWVKDTSSWIHLDIAGPSMPQTINSYNKTFMTGTGVRLLVEFLLSDWNKAFQKEKPKT